MSDSATLTRRELLRGNVLRNVARAFGLAGGAAVADAATQEVRAEPAPRNPAVPPRTETPPPGTERPTEPDMKLPELNQSFLDRQTLALLFRDIEQCTQVLEVIPKFGARRYVPQATIDLDEGRRLLEAGTARAVQIRYVYQDAQWWDTLINTPSGVRVVRIRHEPDRLVPAEAQKESC